MHLLPKLLLTANKTSGRIVVDTTGYAQAESVCDSDGDRMRIFVAPFDPEETTPWLHVTDDVHNPRIVHNPRMGGSMMPGINKPPSRCYETGPEPHTRQRFADAGGESSQRVDNPFSKSSWY